MLNQANRYACETKLKMKGARIYDNVHVSGHAYKEDHWELLRMVKPEHVIPAHGNMHMHTAYVDRLKTPATSRRDRAHPEERAGADPLKAQLPLFIK